VVITEVRVKLMKDHYEAQMVLRRTQRLQGPRLHLGSSRAAPNRERPGNRVAQHSGPRKGRGARHGLVETSAIPKLAQVPDQKPSGRACTDRHSARVKGTHWGTTGYNFRPADSGRQLTFGIGSIPASRRQQGCFPRQTRHPERLPPRGRRQRRHRDLPGKWSVAPRLLRGGFDGSAGTEPSRAISASSFPDDVYSMDAEVFRTGSAASRIDNALPDGDS
jgi:hypothetical protein